MTATQFLALVADEYIAARRKHAAMHSPHEGYAVIAEELDELWDLVRADHAKGKMARDEAIQIAAMCLSYVLEVANE